VENPVDFLWMGCAKLSAMNTRKPDMRLIDARPDMVDYAQFSGVTALLAGEGDKPTYFLSDVEYPADAELKRGQWVRINGNSYPVKTVLTDRFDRDGVRRVSIEVGRGEG
jgi:hypothetical protein